MDESSVSKLQLDFCSKIMPWCAKYRQHAGTGTAASQVDTTQGYKGDTFNCTKLQKTYHPTLFSRPTAGKNRYWLTWGLPPPAGSTIKTNGLLYLELLCQLATEAIKHGQVKGTKVRIKAVWERERRRVCQSGYLCNQLRSLGKFH